MLLLQSFSLRYFVVVAVFASPAVAVVSGYAFAQFAVVAGPPVAVIDGPAFLVLPLLLLLVQHLLWLEAFSLVCLQAL